MCSNLEIALMLFPELRAAIADIAAFMDDDEDPNFDAARQRAVDAYSTDNSARRRVVAGPTRRAMA
jgi:hypothetical protein